MVKDILPTSAMNPATVAYFSFTMFQEIDDDRGLKATWDVVETSNC
jgi:hypothetical protein